MTAIDKTSEAYLNLSDAMIAVYGARPPAGYIEANFRTQEELDETYETLVTSMLTQAQKANRVWVEFHSAIVSSASPVGDLDALFAKFNIDGRTEYDFGFLVYQLDLPMSVEDTNTAKTLFDLYRKD